MKIADIKQQYRIEEVIGRTIPLKPQGPELVGNCIFHSDEHASLKVNPVKQIFKCFACDTAGDMIDFYTLQGYSIQEAKNAVTNGSVIPVTIEQTQTQKQPEIKWQNAVPNQDQLPDVANLQFKEYGKPSNFWAYHNPEGKIIGYTLRFDLPEGKKDVIPYTFKKPDNGSGAKWLWRGFDIPRPLYNLHELTARPDAIVLVVEGEKTADAAKKLFPQYVVTAWIGGADGIRAADWTPLHGRNVFLWPDNDIPGLHAMFGGWSYNNKTEQYRRVHGICELFQANFKWIKNAREFPHKWDLADSDWTSPQAAEYLKANRQEVPAVSAEAPTQKPTPVSVPEIPINSDNSDNSVSKAQNKKSVYVEPENNNPYFKCLGFENNDQNLYVFFVYRTNVIVKLSAGGITAANVLQLAPMKYWEGNYPKNTRSGGVKYDVNVIADTLISTCSKMGFFNESKIRGRGAWKDGDDIVIHCGDTLIVNGIYKKFSDHKSKYIYEAGQELGFSLVEPLKKEEAYKLIKILERLNWARGINARLLAGWIVIAPICGALRWRPHMWLTGSAGSGKSWIMTNLVKKLMDEICIHAQGETTEAGIRQTLRADALPVIFDEAESEDVKGLQRTQTNITLARSASTSDSGKIIKGSSFGSAAQFDIRSCFAFASIGANLTQRSDISRITVLEIKPDVSDQKKEKWQETLSMYNDTVTEEYVQAFLSRSVSLLPVILKNAKTFSNAAAAELDNQRTGDQLGALLAGAYSLTSNKIISFEEARDWIKERDWSEERLQDHSRDEIKVINKIMDAEVNVEGIEGRITRTVGELILNARGDTMPHEEMFKVNQKIAETTLKRIGFRIEGQMVLISDNSDFVTRALSQTPYTKNYHTYLIRMNGAVKVEKTTFGSGVRARATKIDTRIIFENFGNPGITQTEIDLHS